jgi:hypothetical protein
VHGCGSRHHAAHGVPHQQHRRGLAVTRVHAVQVQQHVHSKLRLPLQQRAYTGVRQHCTEAYTDHAAGSAVRRGPCAPSKADSSSSKSAAYQSSTRPVRAALCCLAVSEASERTCARVCSVSSAPRAHRPRRQARLLVAAAAAGQEEHGHARQPGLHASACERGEHSQRRAYAQPAVTRWRAWPARLAVCIQRVHAARVAAALDGSAVAVSDRRVHVLTSADRMRAHRTAGTSNASYEG